MLTALLCCVVRGGVEADVKMYQLFVSGAVRYVYIALCNKTDNLCTTLHCGVFA